MTSSFSENLNVARTNLSLQTSMSDKKKVQCPRCSRCFTPAGLPRHKCVDSNPTSAEALKDKASDTDVATKSDNVPEKTKEPCPKCGKLFTRLASHLYRCKGPESTSQTSDNAAAKKDEKTDCQNQTTDTGAANGKERRGKENPERPASKSQANNAGKADDDKPRQTCPTCGDSFLKLSSHSRWCKGLMSEVEATDSKPVKEKASGKNPTVSKTKRPAAGNEEKTVKQEEHLCSPKTKLLAQPPTSCIARDNVKRDFRSQSAQDDFGYKAIIDTVSLEEEALESVMKPLKLEPAAKPYTEAKKFFKAEVKLEKHEKDVARYVFNPFREKVTKHLEEATGWKWKCFNSGSSYDGTKVTRADEVDCMFTPALRQGWLNVTYEGAPPGFCYIELNRSTRSPRGSEEFQQLKDLCSGDRLSSTKFREKVWKAFEKAVQDKRLVKKDPDAKPGSPSYAVLLKTTETKLKTVSVDLVPALHFKGLPPKADYNLKKLAAEDAEFIRKGGFDVVPKECHKEGYEDVRDLLWRLSFSRAEKRLTLNADKRNKRTTSASAASDDENDNNDSDEDDDDDDNDDGDDIQKDADSKSPAKIAPRTCKKYVLRLLKRLLEIIKGFENSRTPYSPDPKMKEVQKAAEHLRKKGGRNVTIEKFTTFQVRTLLWTQMYIVDPEKWAWELSRTRMILALTELKKMVSGQKHVPHFFIPDLDIMEEVPLEEREFLYIMFHITKDIF
ncbi:uncharacterized protein [Littorina saxatilis]|uniref:Uncharacterized protein n=1 Tax=Littorina saxatilis TaxID=31220 RepID=A0AAN9BPY0_9CAEN